MVVFTDAEKGKAMIDVEESPIRINSNSPLGLNETDDFRPNFTKSSMMRGSLRRTGTQNCTRKKLVDGIKHYKSGRVSPSLGLKIHVKNCLDF